MGKLIEGFQSSKLISTTTLKLSFNKKTTDYYKSVIKYMDEYIYYNFLRLTDPNYGLNFQEMLSYYLRINVGISIPIIIYERKYPDDTEIDFIKLEIIKQNMEEGIYT
jgi:hypothetical protein